MICPNCKSKHGCGCQARIATNGASVCTSCVATYNNSIGKAPVTVPIIPGSTNPSNVGVKYNPAKR